MTVASLFFLHAILFPFVGCYLVSRVVKMIGSDCNFTSSSQYDYGQPDSKLGRSVGTRRATVLKKIHEDHNGHTQS